MEAMMSTIRVGVQLHQQHTTFTSYAKAVQQVESMGVDSIWDCDHFFPLFGDPAGTHFEGWTLLSAIAALTSRAEIGCLVTCASYRNPMLLADMAKTVDHISSGRLILGIGAGFFERDFQEFGYEFGTAPERLKTLHEALPRIKDYWQRCSPTPLRNSIPILVGGGGEKVTLKLAAQYADIWHSFPPLDNFKRKTGVLDNWCKELGREPSTIRRSVSPAPGESLDAYVEAGATDLLVSVRDSWDFKGLDNMLNWRETH
jgi:probable F420-dependent oxidoreductase